MEKHRPGPDGIPSIIIKNLKAILAEPIAEIGRKSLKKGIFPDLHKLSHVIPGKNGEKLK